MIPKLFTPQNLAIVPTTTWGTTIVNGAITHQMYCGLTLNMDPVPGATNYNLTFVAARLCKDFTTENIQAHSGACGGHVTLPFTLPYQMPFGINFLIAGDDFYGVLAAFDGIGGFGYSTPFKWSQPLGIIDGVSFAGFGFNQTPGSMESSFCQSILSIQAGGTPPAPIVPVIPVTTTVKGKRK